MLPLLKRKSLREGVTPLIISTAVLAYYTFVSIHNFARRFDVHPMRLREMAKLGTVTFLLYRYAGLIILVDATRHAGYE